MVFYVDGLILLHNRQIKGAKCTIKNLMVSFEFSQTSGSFMVLSLNFKQNTNIKGLKFFQNQEIQLINPYKHISRLSGVDRL